MHDRTGEPSQSVDQFGLRVVGFDPEIPPDITIGPGREVETTFITQELHDRMVVPKRSIFTYEGEDAVFVVEDDRARVRRVTTGIESRREKVIEEGLREGDLVILDPRLDGLREGARVEVRNR